jgi:hypothetical protein
MAGGLVVPDGVPKGKAGMNPTVIEAAADAVGRILFHRDNGDRFDWETRPQKWERDEYLEEAKELIQAADAARAEAVKAAIAKLIDVCTDDEDEFAIDEDGWLVNRIEDAEYELLSLLGITEGGE